jgi:acyl-CoA thioesterase FadM
VRFTLDQSDANQHVNSNVYVRCFLDACQRRLADDGLPATLRSKAFDIAYRKPCFVGERIRAHIRLFTHGDHVGGAGFLAAPGESSPRCYLRVVFGP